MRVLVFDIDGQRFGLDASGIREVLPAATLAQLPNMPPTIEGVLDLRGTVVPIISMRTALGLERRSLRSTDHLVIANSMGRLVGLHVDHAVEIVNVEESGWDAREDEGNDPESICRVARLDGGLMSVHLVDAIVGDWQLETPSPSAVPRTVGPLVCETLSGDPHANE